MGSLGKVSPELAWERVQDLVQQAIEMDYDQSQKLVEKYDLPIDLPNLKECLALMNPIQGCNHLHYINPELKLKDLMSQSPLKILEAVIRIYTVSDRYQSLK